MQKQNGGQNTHPIHRTNIILRSIFQATQLVELIKYAAILELRRFEKRFLKPSSITLFWQILLIPSYKTFPFSQQKYVKKLRS